MANKWKVAAIAMAIAGTVALTAAATAYEMGFARYKQFQAQRLARFYNRCMSARRLAEALHQQGQPAACREPMESDPWGDFLYGWRRE